jgi:flagellar hook-associated protein 2
LPLATVFIFVFFEFYMATSATSTSGTYFSGSSTFSASLNNVIAHAVATSTLPITELQNEQGTLTGQQTELQTVGSDFTALQTALGAVDGAISSGSLAATVDDTSVASAAVATGALAGSYAVDITALGAQTNTISNSSLPSVADPTSGNISSSSAFTLTVGTATYSLAPASNTLDGLVAAINASGADVQATVVNVGGGAGPHN